MIGWGVAAPHIGEIVVLRSFFFTGVLLGKRTADPEPSSTTCYTSIDAVSAKDVPLGSHKYISSRGEITPTNPSFAGRQWGFPA